VAEASPAVLLVTHDVDEAISLADRVLVLDEAASRSISTLAFRVRARRHSPVLRFAARAARALGVEAHDDAPLEAFAAGI